MVDGFAKAVERCLRSIPEGRVATCGTIAEALGDRRAAKAVASLILAHPEACGAHRAVRAGGSAILPGAGSRLRTDGIRLRMGRVPAGRLVPALPRTHFLTRLRQEQLDLATRVSDRDEVDSLVRIAGVDASYVGEVACVATVVCGAADQEVLEVATTRVPVEFPYIPTYLGYRELPAIESAILRLRVKPDVLLVDGHGRLHPARCGIACMVGVRLAIPTIGVAKHALTGSPRPQRRTVRDAIPVEIEGETLGYAWNPPRRATPLYVSVGHRVSLERALEIVQGCTRNSAPEPIRIADRIAREMKGVEKREKGSRGGSA